jgi:hypothetical protein
MRRLDYKSFRTALIRPDDIPVPSTANDEKNEPLLTRYLAEVIGFLAYSFAMAILVVSWEDVTCSHTQPSRHRTSLSLQQQQQPWGASTIHGMGFGANQRELLVPDPLNTLPSYNEIMLEHRIKTVPRWKETPTKANIQAAIHTITGSLETVWKLQVMAEDYQWDNIRSQLHKPPLQDLPAAAAVLRQIEGIEQQQESIIGFDWGSCAWRHCGAAADAQEALDELDQLLGVLEPFEAVFCLDIVERSLRDIMAVVDWKQASTSDAQFYANLPVYVTKVSADAVDEEDATNKIDEAYFRALQELRID